MTKHIGRHFEMGKAMSTHLIRLTVTLALLVAHTANADTMEHEIDQKNKSFSVDKITIAIGDKIKFVNSDSYFHNVYSLSDTAQFDLGSYPKGDSRTITFDKVGKILAQCAIHPKMRIEISVEEKPEVHADNQVEVKNNEIAESKTPGVTEVKATKITEIETSEKD